MSYAWVVTVDHIDNGAAKGVIGPKGAREDLVDALAERDGVQFRMFDDDMNPYYEGWITGMFQGTEPLDDFGQPNAGCTVIELKEDGVWHAL